MNIFTRVKNILLSPVREWEVIDGESASIGNLYINYAAPLAFIPSLVFSLENLCFGVVMGFDTLYLIKGLIVLMVVSYVLALTGPYGFALIVNAMTPAFGGRPNLVQALKVAVYSVTPVWVASILLFIPMLGGALGGSAILYYVITTVILLAGIYTLTLFWLGLSKLMKVPKENKIGFNIAAFAFMISLGFVWGFAISVVGMTYVFPFTVPA